MKPTITALALLSAVAAHATTYHFDGAPSGTDANTFAKDGIGFYSGILAPNLDINGDPIPGSDHWQIDSSAPAVTVDDPLGFGRGVAPSPANALNGLFQPTLIKLGGSNMRVTDFSVTLDNDTFGDNGLLPGHSDIAVGFYDLAGKLLFSIPLDQTTPGFKGSLGNWVDGVDSIVLPGGAFYDDLTLTAVPEVSTFLPVGAVVGGMLLARRRRQTT